MLSLVAIQRWRRPGSKSAPVAAPAASVPGRKAAMRALQQACAGNDRRAAADALLDLARAEWPDDPPRGLGALAARLEAGRKEVGALDRSLYGTGALSWEGNALWNAFRDGLRPKRGENPSKDDSLGALYPDA
jgi:hypothetical protein